MNKYFIKSWLLLALFFLTSLLISKNLLAADFSTVTKTVDEVANQQRWHSLLHLNNGEPQITDTQFLISLSSASVITFNAKDELIATLELIKASPASAFCRFPARFHYLAQYFTFIRQQLLSVTSCSELKKYNEFVPFDTVSLIYASEVLSSAASMMGHSFLKVSGRNKNNKDVSHSISFFTEFATFNPFQLIYDGTIGGMEGYFLVRPYKNDVAQYLQNEGRNLWEYHLNITEFEKQLIKYHIWELKNLDIKYLFQSYNCATLTLYILSLAEPKLLEHEQFFVSPTDVVKAVHSENLVEDESVALSSDWEVMMFNDELSKKALKAVNQLVIKGQQLTLDDFLIEEQQLMVTYLSTLISNDSILEKIQPENLIFIKKFIDNNKGESYIDLTKYKSPINTPQDSIISVGFGRENTYKFINLNFLSASHFLHSDNSQYFGESELKIAEIEVRADIERSALSLEQLTLYSVTSYIASTTFQPRVSGSFELGAKQIKNVYLDKSLKLYLSGAFGKTFQLTPDIKVYGMLGSVFSASSFNNMDITLEPYLGSIVNLIGQNKLLFEYRKSLYNGDKQETIDSTKLQLAFHGLKNVALSMSLERIKSDKKSDTAAKFSLDYHF